MATLRERGLVQEVTSDALAELAGAERLSVYCGFDPTADSLHLGNLLGIIVLSWFQRCGHEPVALLGGATGRVGDPSGRSAERPILTEDEIEGNVRGGRGVPGGWGWGVAGEECHGRSETRAGQRLEAIGFASCASVCAPLQRWLLPPCADISYPRSISPAAIGQLLNDILRRSSEQGASSSSSSSSSSSGGGGGGGEQGAGSSNSSSSLPAMKVVNNLDWFGPMSFLTFLREVGKFARVGTMLAKDSVRAGAVLAPLGSVRLGAWVHRHHEGWVRVLPGGN